MGLILVPFPLLLLALAAAPLAWPDRWERNRTKATVIAALSAPVIAWLALSGAEGRGELFHAFKEYVSFAAYVGSLYVVATGVRVRLAREATPLSNAAILAAGGVLASLIGTTGASLVLISPLIESNRSRRDRALPVVFFIFVVANGGGLLTPLGDPPLYLGFLRGVPFTWPAQTLYPIWLLFNGLAIAIYLLLEKTKAYTLPREAGEGRGGGREAGEGDSLRVSGWPHALILVVIVAASFLSGKLDLWWVTPLVFALLALASLAFTPARARPGFSWHPLIEVAIVFAGIFATLGPVIPALRELGPKLPLRTPLVGFLLSGGLSSFLDNAPTYLVFFEASASANQHGVGVASTGVPAAELAAISAGCVLMGANTYIGNGPNMLVRSIAEREGVRMPGFVRFTLLALAVLGPIYALLALAFFR